LKAIGFSLVTVVSKHDLEIKEKNIRNLLIDGTMLVKDEHYEGHPWSLVKLVLLGQWAYVYTAILKNWRGGIRYVDLLAGSGTTIVQETNDVIKGSPFVVKEYAYKPFNDYILVEKDAERYKALVENAKLIGNISTPRRGDCNRFVKEIFADHCCHNLVFIDNEGFDVTWESMEQIISAPSDIIINFPTACIPRAIETPNCLDKFYGDHSWYEAKDDREKCLEIYMRNLAKRFYELREKTPYVESIRVGNHSYFYDIILLCKHGDYVNVWGNYLKNRWNWQKPEEMKNLLDYLKGRLRRMDFFNDLEQEVSSIQNKRSKKTELTDKKGKDLKMTDFCGQKTSQK
jgi:three-Cys-motif partner protein